MCLPEEDRMRKTLKRLLLVLLMLCIMAACAAFAQAVENIAEVNKQYEYQG